MRLRLLVVLWLLITCGNVLTQTAPPASNVAGDIPRVRLAESVVAGLRMKYVHPIYPSAASNARIHGDVVLRILIGIDGQVTVLAVVSGPLRLEMQRERQLPSGNTALMRDAAKHAKS